ncbi:hypothetical protein MHB40_14800 [Lysinibacillus sp. FSL K6-0057]|uniref:hypothetical protein n=1 Tax=Lysinibacillus sp. FSL K6-0057 TaxID=2921411 RepID=UPI00315A547B
MTNIYIVLRNGELYHGIKKKPKSVKAFTSKGIADGVVKRDVSKIASEMYYSMDIRPQIDSYETEVYKQFLDIVEKEFEIREINL